MVPFPQLEERALNIRSLSLWRERFHNVLIPKATSFVGEVIKYGDWLKSDNGKAQSQRALGICIEAFSDAGAKAERVRTAWETYLLAALEVGYIRLLKWCST